ncbi:hypothetical protein GpartN1_g3833.t1 [Galdieria partita]|uniref:Histidine--tRNA ligase, cytoplasmic n=1 Tax=Galdieria partita TaxID=83374 RepID=A0A9C7PYW3_9RHOD|nr:hypothetical protein GpartN1_g3833.t1 [Galdieria partita]
MRRCRLYSDRLTFLVAVDRHLSGSFCSHIVHNNKYLNYSKILFHCGVLSKRWLLLKALSFPCRQESLTSLTKRLFGSTTQSTGDNSIGMEATKRNELEVVCEELSNMKRTVKAKVPKGARDFLPEQMAIREKAFRIVSKVFDRHGAVAIDTPVFELKETLTGKYGEDSKLIYDLADQGGELLSLRYDLTVPLARFLATHKITNLKRYHISRVYRRDNPAIQRGRFREFYQCDFDIAGNFSRMVPDAEVIKVLCEVLDDLAAVSSFHAKILSSYKVKVNHRGLLDSIFELCGVPKEKIRAISSAVDKLDKESWNNVRYEMIEKKGLDPCIADKIGSYVLRRDNPQKMLSSLYEDPHLSSIARSSLEDMELLLKYLEDLGVGDCLIFDLSLARGLDYYTGLIFEAVLTTDSNTSLGSIGAGGRYDNLVDMFSSRSVPCVGCSLGIERILTIYETAEREWASSMGRKIKANKTQVWIASIGEQMIRERMKLANELWKGNIAAEFSYAEKPKLNKQLQHALEEEIPLLAIIGEDELKRGMVNLKILATNEQKEVNRTEIVDAVKQALNEMEVAIE